MSDDHLDDLPAASETWRLAPNVRQLWGSQVTAFDCPCGEKEIILSEPGEPTICECGREYRSKFEVQVWGPLKREQETP